MTKLVNVTSTEIVLLKDNDYHVFKSVSRKQYYKEGVGSIRVQNNTGEVNITITNGAAWSIEF